jgi:hypothetical protein
VTVVALDLPRRHGHRTTRNDGVRVRLEQPVKVFRDEWPAGHETEISTRDIEAPWTPEDEEKMLDAGAKRERAARLRAALAEKGLSVSASRYLGDEDVAVSDGGHVTFSYEATEKLLGLNVCGCGCGKEKKTVKSG